MSRAARLGMFIFATLAILVGGIFIIGSKQYLFSSTYQLKTQFANVAGLDAGGDVRVGGVHCGTVRKILLPHRSDEKVVVVMDLDRSTHEIIKQDSIAAIETEGLLGSQFLAISFGSAASPEVHSGDTLASRPPLEISDLLKKTNSILDSSQQAIQNATLATANLKSISAKIDSGQGTVGALVNDKHLYNNLEQTTSDLSETMVQARAGVVSFYENMEALKHNFLLRGFFKSRGYQDSAEVALHEIERLPPGPAAKQFTYPAQQLFDKRDSAKLKNQKSLNAGGEFLANNEFGVAVIVASMGTEGDTRQDLALTEARAMVVREYLVENFGFDDRRLKTLGMGKQLDAPADAGWGTVQILIYPLGTEVPPNKQTPTTLSSHTTAEPSVRTSTIAPLVPR